MMDTASAETKPVAAKPAKPEKVAKIKTPRQVQPGHRAVLIMGYGVLVPLVAMAMVVAMSYPANGVAGVLKLEVTYGATLLMFLGGIRWGIALMSGGEHLRFRPIAAVTLIFPFAFVALFMKPPVALAMLMVGYLALVMGERGGHENPVPSWYHALLKPFTVMVEISLGLTLLIILNF